MTILTTDRPVETELDVDSTSCYRSGLAAAYRELRDRRERTAFADDTDRTTHQHTIDNLVPLLHQHGIFAPTVTADVSSAEDLSDEDLVDEDVR